MGDPPPVALNPDHPLNQAAVVNDMRSDQVGARDVTAELLTYLPEMSRRMSFEDIDYTGDQRALRCTLAFSGRDMPTFAGRVSLDPTERRVHAVTYAAWLDGFSVCLRVLHNIKEEAESAARRTDDTA